MPYEPPPHLASLNPSEIADLVQNRQLPPIETWSPQIITDSLMVIKADGRWFHDGGEITRPAMVRAFSSLLWRDQQGLHWLLTPHEKAAIQVEDAAFMAIDMVTSEDNLVFRLNTDDSLIAGSEHPLIARGDPDNPAIYIHVRHGLEARLNRSTYLQLAELAIQDPYLKISSQNQIYSLFGTE